MRTLSEKEIQSKLYGNYRPPTDNNGKKEAPRPQPQSTSTVTISGPDLPPDDLFEHTPPPRPEVQKSPSLTPEPKLVTESQSSDSKPNFYSTVFANGSVVPRADATAKSQPRSPSFSPTKKKSGFSFKPISAAFKKVGSGVLFFLTEAVGAILQFLMSLRKIKIKRFASVFAAIAFIALLFFSAHFLNMRRERAMELSSSGGGNSSAAEKTSRPVRVEPVKPSKPREVTITPVTQLPARKAESSQSREPKPVLNETSEPVVSAANNKAFYSAQVATYAIEADADRLVAKLKEEEAVDAFVRGLGRPGGRVYYCVFIGKYPDYKSAKADLDEFIKRPAAKPFQDAFIRTFKNG